MTRSLSCLEDILPGSSHKLRLLDPHVRLVVSCATEPVSVRSLTGSSLLQVGKCRPGADPGAAGNPTVSLPVPPKCHQTIRHHVVFVGTSRHEISGSRIQNGTC